MSKKERQRAESKRIAEETVKIFQRGSYINLQHNVVELKQLQQAAMNNTILYKPEELTNDFVLQSIENIVEKVTQRSRVETIIKLVAEPTLTALSIIKNNEDPNDCKHIGILNFASAKNPGGGFLSGAQAQEESLARASGLYFCLKERQCARYYTENKRDEKCVYTNHTIFSVGVPIIRMDDGLLLDSPILASIITVPAVNAGVAMTRLKGSPANNKKQILEVQRARIRFTMAIAAKNDCDCLILGAFGCGVFKNDPAEIARIFYELLQDEFKNCFSMIYFAIPNANSENYLAFANYFQ